MKIVAKKHLSQFFLHKKETIDEIIRHVAPRGKIVEIGPGEGALTCAMLPLCTSLIAVEIDFEAATYLKRTISDSRFSCIQADILHYDWQEPVDLVVGNLPYHLSTPILLRIAEQKSKFRRAFFIVEDAFAEKVRESQTAIHTFISTFFDIDIAMQISRYACHPVPKVHSSLLRLIPKPAPEVNLAKYYNILSRAFRARRKKIRSIFPESDLFLDKRPHELTT